MLTVSIPCNMKAMFIQRYLITEDNVLRSKALNKVYSMRETASETWAYPDHGSGKQFTAPCGRTAL